MTLSLHALATDTFAPMLESLSAILDKAAAHPGAEALDLPNARLAPDMFTLAQQVANACTPARDAMLRLAGAAASEPEGAAVDLAGMKAQIDRAVAIVRAADPAGFAGAEARDCSIPLPTGGAIVLTGEQYLTRWALPQFYFHLVTAYDILRHKGVDIGKRDYLSGLAGFIRA